MMSSIYGTPFSSVWPQSYLAPPFQNMMKGDMASSTVLDTFNPLTVSLAYFTLSNVHHLTLLEPPLTFKQVDENLD